MIIRSISESSPARSSSAPLFSALSLRSHLGDLCVAVPRSSYSAVGCKPSTANCELCAWSTWATAPLRLVPAPRCTTTLSIDVGAPTYCTSFTTGASTFKSGPPKKDGPYTNCQLSFVNCEQNSPKHALCREIIKYVGAPTFLIPRTSRKLQSLPTSEGGLYKNFQPLLSFFSALLLATSHWSLATKSIVGAPTFSLLHLRFPSRPPPIQFDRCARLAPESHWNSRRTPATPRSTHLRAILVDS